MRIVWTGYCSTFGGFEDKTMASDSGLALYQPREADNRPDLFLPYPEFYPNIETWKRLRTESFYIALQWIAGPLRADLQKAIFRLTNPTTGAAFNAHLVDRGPDLDLNILVDMSPGLQRALGVNDETLVDVQLLDEIEGFELDPRVKCLTRGI